MKVLVTGANGQLGQEIGALASSSPHDFVFMSSGELNITEFDQVQNAFTEHEFDACINCIH